MRADPQAARWSQNSSGTRRSIRGKGTTADDPSALSVAPELADDPAHTDAVLDALSHPYAAYQLDEVRRLAYVAASWRSGRCDSRTVGALSALEPHALWMKPILEMRALCYRDAGLFELAERARIDLAAFDAAEARAISSSVPSARASPPP